MPIINTTTAYAFDNATISSTAQTLSDVGFSDANIDDAQSALISCDTNPIRYRYDGTAPTAGAGMYLNTGTFIWIDGNENIRNLQFIAASSDGVISITLEK